MKLTLFSDGGARGNPGPAAIGVVIYNEKNEVVDQISKTIGDATNNVAEYEAIIAGLTHAKKLKATEVTCFLDSELVVKQLNGEYKVKDATLATKFMKVWQLRPNFKKITFAHIRREKNTVADALVNKALDHK